MVMETLLKVGDEITIRNDIKEKTTYRMILNSDCNNTYIKGKMLKPGTLVRIVKIDSGHQYRVVECSNNDEGEDDSRVSFWAYTDEMFDPELLQMILEDRYNN